MSITHKLNGLQGLREYFKNLLETGKIDEILIPKLNSAKDNYVQALISDTDMLEDTNPFVPVIPVQTGRIAKNLTFTNSGKKLLIVCKPCEIKAIVELTKFKQVNLDNVFLVAVDCSGTFELNDFQEILLNNSDYINNYTKVNSGGDLKAADNFSFRKSCSMCTTPAINADLVDAVIGYYGASGDELFLIAKDDSNLKGSFDGSEIDLSKRDEIINKITDEKSKVRDEILENFKKETSSLEGLQKLLSKCIRCHNCMVACPICYCKECVFRSPTFDHSADMITTWAERKGGMRMLENTMMFHLTRLNHMSSSCIACGLCSSACPNDIDVSTLFISTALNVQKMLEYNAGASFDEPAPVSTFRENELVVEAGTNE